MRKEICEKDLLLRVLDAWADEMFALACNIFDHPEWGREELYASKLLADYLEKKGFIVERGVGGLPTAFRAIWERGYGGPAIGFLMEYDALRNMGHACGHHLQGPAVIAAALALRETCCENFKLVLYGTPDEEENGGKIQMAAGGCFQDVDVMFGTHAHQHTSVSYGTMALAPTRVQFHGSPAHAAGSPWKGRSALDAAVLCFHALEMLREHVKDGCRIHYTFREGTGPSNIVHETANVHITLRARERHYLEEMVSRMRSIIQGACLMTGTTADITPLPAYWNCVPVNALREVVLDMAEEIDAPKLSRAASASSDTTDVGNVSWIVPTVNVNSYYGNLELHTIPFLEAGKSEQARIAMLNASKIIGLSALHLIHDKTLLESVRKEHTTAIQNHD